MRFVTRINVIAAGALLCFGLVSYAQQAQFPEGRDLIQRVQEDMRRAAEFARGSLEIKKDHKQIERWDNAQRSMSNFDRHLSKGKFDKGELDSAINDLKNAVEHNTLSSLDRDALNRDLSDLRQFRANRD